MFTTWYPGTASPWMAWLSANEKYGSGRCASLPPSNIGTVGGQSVRMDSFSAISETSSMTNVPPNPLA
jgi:hypothetical protein